MLYEMDSIIYQDSPLAEFLEGTIPLPHALGVVVRLCTTSPSITTPFRLD